MIAFVSETEKGEKAPRGLSALLWWAKSAPMMFKEAAVSDKGMAPSPIPFLGLCLAQNKEPSPWPPARLFGLGLDWHV